MEQGTPAFIMNSLMTADVEFKWTQRNEDTLQELRRIVLETDICLYTPDHNHKLILETDTSTDGWGTILLNGRKRNRTHPTPVDDQVMTNSGILLSLIVRSQTVLDTS